MVKHRALFWCSELINNKNFLLQSEDNLLSFAGIPSQPWLWLELQFNPHRNSKLLQLRVATRLVLVTVLLAAKEKQFEMLIWQNDETPVFHYRGISRENTTIWEITCEKHPTQFLTHPIKGACTLHRRMGLNRVQWEMLSFPKNHSNIFIFEALSLKIAWIINGKVSKTFQPWH